MIDNQQVIEKFNEIYRHRPIFISSAPGRINLIGEHTDYNGGFVLPVAINQGIKMAAILTEEKMLYLFSDYYSELLSISIENPLNLPKEKSWYSYFLGVLDQFMRRNIQVPGMKIVISGNVPLGVGLSSSAAYEVCACAMLNEITKANLSKKEIALLSQSAEHSEFVGVQCGIMDQFSSALGQKDKALFIDCYSLNYELVPFDSNKVNIVIINTMRKRGLVDSEYNQRRKECEDGLRLISELSGNDYPSVRHISLDVFEKHKNKLPLNIRKRLTHNLTENTRVIEFKKALEENNFIKAGNLLYQSHKSLRDDFEVSCDELDAIVEIVSNYKRAYGCRMTGAGFGGCAIALANPKIVDGFSEFIIKEYRKKVKVEPEIYISQAANGVLCKQIH